jgi:transposase
LGAIFVSLELSRSTWLITSLSPGGGEKMSKHGLSAGNIAALLARLSELKQKAFARTGQSFQAGLDGFWIHRVLQSEGVESHVVDSASIASSRRRRRAKTNRIDAKPWCALCWRTNAANRGSAPWSGRRRQRKKTAADVAVSARR